MALTKAERDNFDTLKRAAQAGHLALMECTDAKTGEHRAVICAVYEENGQHCFVPFGHLCPDNPYEAYTPPE